MKTLIVFSILVACLLVLVVFVLPRTPASEPAEKHNAAPVWNTSAIQSSFAGVQVKEVDATHANLIFSYDLDNNTDTDYQVTKGPTTVVMTRLASSGSVSSDEPVALGNSVFLPARNRTRVTLELIKNFNWPGQMYGTQVGPVNQEKFRTLVAQEVANLSGFVLFDQATHFQIELPGDWQELQKRAAAAGPS
ncbi:MAG TPA: hypothetical protein VGD60_01915 [Candidatus Acidoferrales bacterium]